MRSQRSSKNTHMAALCALWYNFVRVHKSLRASPAMAPGIEARQWSMGDVLRLIEARGSSLGRAAHWINLMPYGINVRRGAIRLWIVWSIAWLLFVAWRETVDQISPVATDFF